MKPLAVATAIIAGAVALTMDLHRIAIAAAWPHIVAAYEFIFVYN